MTQTANQGSIGASQQGPNDSSSEYSKVAFLVRQLIAQIETMMPVQVTAAHPGSGSPPAAGTVDVQLLVSQLDGNGNAVPHGIVYGLPYFRMQGGPWAIVLDPAANDFGFIIAAARDITAVEANPGIQTPGSLRKYSYSDGVYVGGILNAAPEFYIWLTSILLMACPSVNTTGNLVVGTGASGSFTTPTGQTVTVQDGIITNIF